MCKPSSAATQAVAADNKFASTLQDQTNQVFGADNTVVNEMHAANAPIIAGGINQQGFSQAELNAKNAAAITNDANAARFAAGATRTAQSAFGGGNTVSGAGVTTGQNLAVAQRSAEKTASDLNTITQQNYETGRENFFNAQNQDIKATGVFDNVAGVAGAATNAGKVANEAQANLDTQAGWWKAPVMGLVSGVTSMATGGLSNLASGKLFNGDDKSS
jgi:hypothetical protein